MRTHAVSHAFRPATVGIAGLLSITLMATSAPGWAAEQPSLEGGVSTTVDATNSTSNDDTPDPVEPDTQRWTGSDGLPELCVVAERSISSPSPLPTQSTVPSSNPRPGPYPSPTVESRTPGEASATSPSPMTPTIEAPTLSPGSSDSSSLVASPSPHSPVPETVMARVVQVGDERDPTIEPSAAPGESAAVESSESSEASPSPDPPRVESDSAEEVDEDSLDPIAEESASSDAPVDSARACPVSPIDMDTEPGVNQVTVSWSPGILPKDDARFATADGYAVTVTGQQHRVLRTTETSITVMGLRNGVEYEFAVYALTRAGRSAPAGPVVATPTTGVEGVVAGLIVEFEANARPKTGDDRIPGAERINEVDLSLGEQITDEAVLIELSEPVDLETARQLASALAADEDVAWAEPDQFFFTSGDEPIAQAVSVPSDAQYATDQWNLWDDFGVGIGDSPTTMTDAWAGPRGEGVTIAVIDTGITDHPQLNTQLVSGYDFVSSPENLAAIRQTGAAQVAFDGDYVDEQVYGPLGRDDDPTDPGDWRGVWPARDSTWHGTKVAGVIAAAADGESIAGIAPDAKIQPIRALSWRGGLLSDIAAAVTWASGGEVEDIPANKNPSKVVNMSFAVESVCPTTLQRAIEGAIERGAILVAAAGNAGADAGAFAPGNCDGVITVAATNRDGNRADYSNHGETIDIAAPGGDSSNAVTVTSNTGIQSAALPTTVGDRGTSIAAAHVSAAAAILLSREPSFDPLEVFEQLTGRSFTKAFGNDTCDPPNPNFTCGAGIVSLGFVQTASTNCTRTETNLTGNGSGGTVSGRNYVVVTFSTVGSCSWTPPRGVTSVDYLVVGGGGGGGSANRSGRAGGGGGGGEVVQGTGLSVTAGTPLDIQVGAGGAGSRTAAAVGALGGTSRLGALQASGGGGGASVSNIRPTAGFTGGGGAAPNATNRTGAGVSPRKGGNGNTSTSLSAITAGGGAGAGGDGANGTSAAGGRGGAGIASTITGTTISYGGGGGGGKAYHTSGSAGAGADGGGSGGRNAVGAHGINGRGGGGGGAGVYTTSSTFVRAAGNGGSGLVIVRFATPIPDSVRLSYDANGGGGAPVTASATADTRVTVSPSTPTRTGFVFLSWNTAADGSGTSYAPNEQFTMPWSDLTLYARWAVLGHLVTYEANQGTGAPGEQVAAFGDTITLASQGSMSRPGYEFVEWNSVDDGSGDAYGAGARWTVDKDLTLYAQWRIRSFTVSYSANGGASPPTSQTADYESEIDIPSDIPARTGYTFTGWNASADGSGAAYQPEGSLTIPAENITLYAQWSPTTQILTYSANGGSGAPQTEVTFALAALTVATEQPTRAGYRFASWNTSVDGTGDSYAPGDALRMPATDLSLFAQWIPVTYSLTYDAAGGSGAPPSTSSSFGTSVTVPMTTPSRDGYGFNGWSTTGDESGVTWNPGATFTVTGNVVFHAQWIANTYTLRYNGNGGGGAPVPAAIATGATVRVASAQPTRVGHTFTGWNTMRDGSGSTYASGASFVMPGGDVTLYAQWSGSTFTVAYDANGGSGAPGSTSRGYLASTPVAQYDPSVLNRSGHAFTGWNTSADGSGTAYSPGGSFLMPATNITLFAQWMANKNAVIYDANGGSGGPRTASASSGARVVVASEAPARSGYTFTGWLDSDNETLQAGDEFTMPSASAVLKAVWSIRSFAVNYSANGGAGAPGGSAETFGAASRVSSVEPTREGFLFTGWNTRLNGSGIDYLPNAVFSMPAEDLTFFAQWRPLSSAAASQNFGPATPDTAQSTIHSAALTCRATVCAIIRKPLPVPTLAPEAKVTGVAMDGQRQVALSLKSVGSNGGVEVRGDGFGVVLKRTAVPSLPSALSDEGALVLPEGGRLEASGDGFMADSVVRGFIIPREVTGVVRAIRSSVSVVDLGEVGVDSRGDFSTSWEIPRGLNEGDYTLQLNGLNPREEVRSLNLAVSIKRSSETSNYRVSTRAGFFNPNSDDVSVVGKRKIQSVVDSLPQDVRLAQVIVAGVSVGHPSKEMNESLAERRASNLAVGLQMAGLSTDSVPVVYRTLSSFNGTGDSLVGESILRNSRDKPLSTITLVFEGPEKRTDTRVLVG